MQLSAKGADAELTKDSIVSALGYTPEKLDAGWEKIESFTISDDETTEIVRTQEPDGTPYDFKSIWIFLRGKQAKSRAYFFLNDSSAYIGCMITSTQNDYWCYAQYEIRGELIEGGYLASSAFLGSMMSYRNNPAHLGTYCGGKKSINSVKIRFDGTVAFTSGTLFYIYAVRAT